MPPPRPSSTLFPYTTLFRSSFEAELHRELHLYSELGAAFASRGERRHREHAAEVVEHCVERRSEEHTSELQSPDHLVCRLLLEKKKPTTALHAVSLVFRNPP